MTKNAYSIEEWSRLNGLSRSLFYKLDREGKAPRTFYVNERRLVSAEADAEWRREREHNCESERPPERPRGRQCKPAKVA